MNLDLTDEEAAALLRQLGRIIDGDRYFRSPRIKTLKAIRTKIRPEPPKASHPSGSRCESRWDRRRSVTLLAARRPRGGR